MKPIIKKYENKDLNIAYNDGYNKGKEEFLSKLQEFAEHFRVGEGYVLADTQEYLDFKSKFEKEEK